MHAQPICARTRAYAMRQHARSGNLRLRKGAETNRGRGARKRKADERVGGRESSKEAQRDLARARARGLRSPLTNKTSCSETKLTRARKAESCVEQLKGDVEQLRKDLADMDRPAAVALTRQVAMPIMHETRVEGQTGGVALPIAVRALAYGQLARLTSPRAVGQNIAAVVRCVVPWLHCTEATYDTVIKLHSEMTVLGEMLAARRVAELKRVLSFGFD
eukprot:865633-Pleurochrysis_carterae.AAC.1